MANKIKYYPGHGPLPVSTYVHKAVAAPNPHDIRDQTNLEYRTRLEQKELNDQLTEAVIKYRANLSMENEKRTHHGASDQYRIKVNELRLQGQKRYGGYMTPEEQKILEKVGTLPGTKGEQKHLSDSLTAVERPKQQQVQQQYTQSKSPEPKPRKPSFSGKFDKPHY